MRILKIHKRSNMRITSLHYSRPIENSSKWENYTEISCWYDNDCENCPMGVGNKKLRGRM